MSRFWRPSLCGILYLLGVDRFSTRVGSSLLVIRAVMVVVVVRIAVASNIDIIQHSAQYRRIQLNEALKGPLNHLARSTSPLDDQDHAFRSEEHTSELQSPLNLVCR